MNFFDNIPNIDADGIHVPTYQETLDRLIEQYNIIFGENGEDVYLGEETPDYQLLSVFAKFLDDYASIAVDIYNSRNPNFATGPSLDLLLPLNGMTRNPATKSTVTLKVSGLAGYVLEAGSQVIDDNGYVWSTTDEVTFTGPDHEIEVGATCDTAGAISAPAGTINKAYKPVVGWSTVNNEVDATLGKNAETDSEVRARRNLLFSRTASGTAEAIVRAIMDVDEVTFVNLLRNDTNVTDSNGIPGHSICALVVGGDDYEIAEAIWKNKAPGVGTYGGAVDDPGKTTVDYVGSNGLTNTVYFQRPSPAPVTVSITLSPFTGFDGERCVDIIKGAVREEINALGIGTSWNVTTAYRDIYNAFAGIDCPFSVTAVTGKLASGTAQAVNLECAYNKYFTCVDADISVYNQEGKVWDILSHNDDLNEDIWGWKTVE